MQGLQNLSFGNKRDYRDTKMIIIQIKNHENKSKTI